MTPFNLSGKMKFPVFLVGTALMLLFPFQASARYDPAFQWYTVRTDHFIIYYPKGHELVAQRVLSLCEEVHKDVTGFLGFEPQPCPIILDPGTDLFERLSVPVSQQDIPV
jgi:hypothetical protein